jgi:hypothetical protein
MEPRGSFQTVSGDNTVKRDCFYKVTVTTCVPDSINMFEDEEVYHWGYFPYSMVLKDVKTLYKEGADAVELEMITQKQFDKRIEPYTS